jgi:hypothetical protein
LLEKITMTVMITNRIKVIARVVMPVWWRALPARSMFGRGVIWSVSD